MDVNVSISGTPVGTYSIVPSQSKRQTFPGVSTGPVQVSTGGSSAIIASEGMRYSPNGGVAWTNYGETMGLPSKQLTTSYTFPWYNNVEIDSQLLFGNVGLNNTDVTVTIGGVVQNGGVPYTLTPNQGMRVSYAGVNNGPVVIQSSGENIVASLRVADFSGSTVTNYTEMIGMPSGQLTTSYTFPYYNNVDLNSQLRFGNVGNATTKVTVKIAGNVYGPYTLAPNQSVRMSYKNVSNGPVVVQSSGGVPIIASMRVVFWNGSAWKYFTEMMGLPTVSLSTKYVFPIYDNVTYNMQLRFGNVGTTSTTVTVKVAGLTQGTYVLKPSQSIRVSYASLNAGPVTVESSGSVKIIASKRFVYWTGTAWTGFTELMGLPAEKLDTSYYFPWYNNLDVNSQVNFGQP